jgi:hypothetical protein
METIISKNDLFFIRQFLEEIEVMIDADTLSNECIVQLKVIDLLESNRQLVEEKLNECE